MTRALPTRSLCLVLTAAVVLASTAWPLKRRPRVVAPVPTTVIAADSLALRQGDVTAFRTWARGASLDELMYVLRRSPSDLGAFEAPAVDAALARVPAGGSELRARLWWRAAAAAKPRRGAPRAWAPTMPSAFRVALIVPERGDYATDAAAFEAGFRAGLAARPRPSRPPLEIVRVASGDDATAGVAGALDAAAAAAIVCGGFTRDAALVLATATRTRGGAPLLVAGSDDPAPTTISPRAWLVGPSVAVRGRLLALASGVAAGDRVATLVSSASDTAFAAAFADECRLRGATVVLRLAYATGQVGFAAESRALQRERAGLLFWDGDPNEAAALLRQLTRDRVSLRLCGGAGFDPSRHHRETRVFLEGARWIGADWSLADSTGAALDRALAAMTPPAAPAGPMHVRGWICGSVAAATLAGDRYTTNDVADALRRLVLAGAAGDAPSPRTLDAPALGAVLPVWVVREGRSEPAVP